MSVGNCLMLPHRTEYMFVPISMCIPIYIIEVNEREKKIRSYLIIFICFVDIFASTVFILKVNESEERSKTRNISVSIMHEYIYINTRS